MVRISGGPASKRKHKKVLDLAKGFWMSRSKQFKKAQETVLHAGQYAFAGRKLRKRDMRRLWIVQLGNAVREEGLSYSKFIAQMKAKKVMVDRKMLADLAVNHISDFKKLVSQVTA